MRLNKIGYKLPENDILNQVTKDALFDFQRKNGLKEGQLDFKTLEKLKIKTTLANSKKEKLVLCQD